MAFLSQISNVCLPFLCRLKYFRKKQNKTNNNNKTRFCLFGVMASQMEVEVGQRWKEREGFYPMTAARMHISIKIMSNQQIFIKYARNMLIIFRQLDKCLIRMCVFACRALYNPCKHQEKPSLQTFQVDYSLVTIVPKIFR